jgi:hypothetical protein
MGRGSEHSRPVLPSLSPPGTPLGPVFSGERRYRSLREFREASARRRPSVDGELDLGTAWRDADGTVYDVVVIRASAEVYAVGYCDLPQENEVLLLGAIDAPPDTDEVFAVARQLFLGCQHELSERTSIAFRALDWFRERLNGQAR